MTLSVRERGIGAILLDIEGTTTPIAFVHDVLFPYARRHLREWLQAHRDSHDCADLISAFRSEHAIDIVSGNWPDPWRDATPDETLTSVATYSEWLMDRDRKSPALKRLQGEIWDEGYRSGELKGEVFPDTAPAIRRWRAAGLGVAIYSSGSTLAQRLLFASTPDGDLTPLMSGFFDTSVGPKTASESYARIVHALGRPPKNVLFLSDVVAELSAARAAGLQVMLSIRPGNATHADAHAFESVHSFDEI